MTVQPRLGDFSIGQAAERSGLSPRMIRYYEALGLVPATDRSDAGYRFYSEEQVETLSFIRRARELGFSVDAVAGLLALWRDRHRSDAEVCRKAHQCLRKLDERADELQAMSSALRDLIQGCEAHSRPASPSVPPSDRGRAMEAQGVSARRRGKRL